MTTYTLTETQRQQLLLALEWSLPHDDAALAHAASFVMLQNLTSNGGEMAAPSTSPLTDDEKADLVADKFLRTL